MPVPGGSRIGVPAGGWSGVTAGWTGVVADWAGGRAVARVIVLVGEMIIQATAGMTIAAGMAGQSTRATRL